MKSFIVLVLLFYVTFSCTNNCDCSGSSQGAYCLAGSCGCLTDSDCNTNEGMATCVSGVCSMCTVGNINQCNACGGVYRCISPGGTNVCYACTGFGKGACTLYNSGSEYHSGSYGFDRTLLTSSAITWGLCGCLDDSDCQSGLVCKDIGFNFYGIILGINRCVTPSDSCTPPINAYNNDPNLLYNASSATLSMLAQTVFVDNAANITQYNPQLISILSLTNEGYAIIQNNSRSYPTNISNYIINTTNSSDILSNSTIINYMSLNTLFNNTQVYTLNNSIFVLNSVTFNELFIDLTNNTNYNTYNDIQRFFTDGQQIRNIPLALPLQVASYISKCYNFSVNFDALTKLVLNIVMVYTKNLGLGTIGIFTNKNVTIYSTYILSGINVCNYLLQSKENLCSDNYLNTNLQYPIMRNFLSYNTNSLYNNLPFDKLSTIMEVLIYDLTNNEYLIIENLSNNHLIYISTIVNNTNDIQLYYYDINRDVWNTDGINMKDLTNNNQTATSNHLTSFIFGTNMANSQKNLSFSKVKLWYIIIVLLVLFVLLLIWSKKIKEIFLSELLWFTIILMIAALFYAISPFSYFDTTAFFWIGISSTAIGIVVVLLFWHYFYKILVILIICGELAGILYLCYISNNDANNMDIITFAFSFVLILLIYICYMCYKRYMS